MSLAQRPLPEGALRNPAFIFAGARGLVVSGNAETTAFAYLDAGSLRLTPGPPGPPVYLGITVGPDGNPWYLASAGSDLGIYDATPLGAVLRASLPAGQALDMVTGPDNAVYVAGRDAIYRYVPGGAVTSHEAPAPRYLVSGPDGAVWFTSDWQGGAIGRITVSGQVSVYRLPGAVTGPMGIVVGPDRAIYAALANAGAIARISPPSGQITLEPVPDPQHKLPGDGGPMPERLTVGPDGAIWFTDPGDDSVGRKTINGQISEIPIPPLSRAEQAYPETPLSLAITDAVPTAIATAPGGLILVTEADAKSVATMDPNGTPAPATPPTPTEPPRKLAPRKRCKSDRAPPARHRSRSRLRSRSMCRRAPAPRQKGHAHRG